MLIHLNIKYTASRDFLFRIFSIKNCERLLSLFISQDMDIYCMRHGRTNFNDLLLCNDDPKQTVYLTKKGIEQAESAALELCHIPFDRIIVSPLVRTRQTAEIVNRYHSVSIEVHPGLLDIRSGFDGKPVADYFAAIADDPLHKRVNGGESLLDHKQRIIRFIDWLKIQKDNTLLIVAHEETLRVFVAYFEGGIADHQLRDIHINNCEFKHYTLSTIK